MKYTMFEYDYSGINTLNKSLNTDKYTSKMSSSEIPIIIGMEAKLSENLTGRFSFNHNL
jgi:hypothetical protein